MSITINYLYKKFVIGTQFLPVHFATYETEVQSYTKVKQLTKGQQSFFLNIFLVFKKFKKFSKVIVWEVIISLVLIFISQFKISKAVQYIIYMGYIEFLLYII